MLCYPVASKVDAAVWAFVGFVGARGEVGREVLPLTAMTTLVMTLDSHQVTVATVRLHVHA